MRTVFAETFNMTYRDEDSILYYIYQKQIFSDFDFEDLKGWLKKMHLTFNVSMHFRKITNPHNKNKYIYALIIFGLNCCLHSKMYIVKAVQDDISSKTIPIWLHHAVHTYLPIPRKDIQLQWADITGFMNCAYPPPLLSPLFFLMDIFNG